MNHPKEIFGAFVDKIVFGEGSIKKFFEKYATDNVSMIGTALHERIQSREEAIHFFRSQRKQTKELTIRFSRKFIRENFIADDSVYLIEEDIQLSIKETGQNVLMRLSVTLERQHDKWVMVQGHASSPDPEIDVKEHLPVIGLQKRNEALEAKIRERTRALEIEACLERVRAETMGMQSSEDLSKVASVMFDQMKNLGGSLFAFGIVLCDKQRDSVEQWHSLGNKGMITPFTVPIDLDDIHRYRYDQWKAGEKLFSIEIPETYIREHFTLMFELPSVKAAMDEVTTQGAQVDIPDWEIDYGASFKHGYLLISSLKLFKEDHIFPLFANVFEQAYTRFLDLQKAERQAREAQIEAALERVRAASMSMHNSEELQDVVAVVFEKLMELGFELEKGAAIIITFIKGSKDHYEWIADPIQTYVQRIEFPYYENPLVTDIINGWKKGTDFYSREYSFRVKNDFFRYAFKYTDYKYIPDARKKTLLKAEKYSYSIAFEKNSAIGIPDATGKLFSKEKEDILKRLTHVFEQAYTRFLDLQKAEKQAREAQIETALERVRSRAMAMQSSDELAGLILTIFRELQKLDMELTRCLLWIFNAKDKSATAWMANSEDPDQADSFHVPYHDNPAYKSLLKGWQTLQEKWEYALKGKVKDRWDEVLVYDYFRSLPSKVKKAMKDLARVMLSGSFNKFGVIQTASLNPLSDENQEILLRFSQVFEQNYTRFLDLQKAEAQAREAQIETALEKVRSASMAMHRSEELEQVVEVTFRQLQSLRLPIDGCQLITFEDQSRDLHFWSATPDMIYSTRLNIPYFAHPIFSKFWEARDRGDTFTSFDLTRAETLDFYNHLYDKTNLGITVTKERWEKIQSIEHGFKTSWGIQKNTGLWIFNFTNQQFSEEENSVIDRFAKVFEQTYTRFLDLQKAEAQAREAQIEAALERVRTRSMAMHDSNELREVAALMYKQMEPLELAKIGCEIILCNEENDQLQFWSTNLMQSELPEPYNISRFSHPFFRKQWRAWKQKQDRLVITNAGKVKRDFDDFIFTKTDFSKFPRHVKKFIRSGKKDVFSHAIMKFGLLEAVDDAPLSEEKFQVLARFAKVFEQTYTRFLDLKKAEAQAREATIEASLERVRSKALTMHSPEDLVETVNQAFAEFDQLGISFLRCGILRIFEDQTAEVYSYRKTEGQLPRAVIGMMKLTGHELLDGAFEHWILQKEYNLEIKGAAVKRYYELISSQVDIPGIEYNKPHTAYGFYFPEGALYIFTLAQLPQEHLEIMRRIRTVLALTYRRYIELQEAEIREREAIRQASVDRVRGEIASMRTAEDLERITPLVWQELTVLGVPFFRCGVFIIKEEEEMVHAYLSTPTGKSLAALHIPFSETEIGMIQPSIDNWRNQTVYREEWDQKQFIQNMQLFMKQGLIENAKQYQAGGKPPERLVLQLVPFKQGMLYVGNSEPLVQEHVELMQYLASAFAVAYARYEDFVQLEDAKLNIEHTLTDLKATQNQLVHSEKMASLGELTAGIAHEIQNPLNFVNNFSDLNKELLAELKDAIRANDHEEIEALTNDLLANEEKVTHHGKRAEQIVKSMLQHSRTGSGENELTDINALCDEYLRLAYHGFRAKDKGGSTDRFNADFKLDLDPALPKIEVVPQDIGRVLLNLINNAFQAASSKLKAESEGQYNPIVTVTTQHSDGRVQITVSDNGPGIPDNIKDKIFQPFFTTKPTGEGTGLGLSMSYDIITKGHGGELKLNSNQGEGSEFIILLPLV